jgi:hypothetical protein
LQEKAKKEAEKRVKNFQKIQKKQDKVKGCPCLHTCSLLPSLSILSVNINNMQSNTNR